MPRETPAARRSPALTFMGSFIALFDCAKVSSADSQKRGTTLIFKLPTVGASPYICMKKIRRHCRVNRSPIST